MNFYDKVHDMIRCLKDTQEFKEYVKLKETIKENKELSDKIVEFREFQKSEHMKYLKGETLDESSKAKLNQMYTDIVKEELGANFFQAEIRIDVILADMQKIISDGIQDVIEY